ncbi:hypothetical protein EDD41_1698 [Luteococcus japonicus]|uniref:Lipoprotein n=1 Tax=Luteococcus japonicus TaxID=33984 RepID=A0A3N1ZUM1_9ACTN|nr:hypothetical protein [Luteococcus japonicus]ROR54486.1 hypothetical protein EDD41_1698 [Luteococcus japonicus]
MTTAGRRPLTVLVAGALLVTSGCSGKDDAQAPNTPTPPQYVTLSYTPPADMTEVSLPASTPSGGVRSEVKLFRSSDGCQLRVVRLLIDKGDGTEDQDATYNMLGAIMKVSGISTFQANGLMVPGDPGPVPTLTASGATSTDALRAAGRLSNESLQGYQLVYGCPKAKMVEKKWTALTDSLRVDGFTGSLEEH